MVVYLFERVGCLMFVVLALRVCLLFVCVLWVGFVYNSVDLMFTF